MFTIISQMLSHAITFLPYVQEVPGSNVQTLTNLRFLLIFPGPFYVTAGIVLRMRKVPSTSSSSHYSLYFLEFETVLSELIRSCEVSHELQ